jgi:ribonuclease R
MHEIAVKLNIPVKSRTTFFNIVYKMQKNGNILITDNGKLVSSRENGSTVTATILSVNEKGAFARPEGGKNAEKQPDIFISSDNLNGAMPSDTVYIKIIRKSAEHPIAVVMSVKKRGFSEFTGIFHRIGKHAYVLPDAKYKGKIRVDAKKTRLINDGDMVYAKVNSYPHKGTEPVATIIESYGPANSAKACCQAILDRYHARKEFPLSVIDEAKSVSHFEIDSGRTDLRDLPIFTIDGATAKDLDDAISIEKEGNGFRLGVHIADVSYYVKEDSQLDNEAFLRGTSIYFGNTVVPMLPKELSNGICSLNPGEDRLTFSAFMDIDENGTLKSYKLEKSVIRSRVKGVYDEVNAIFDGSADEKIKQKYSEVLPSLDIMRKLAAILRASRYKRGAIDFKTDESELIIDDYGVCCGVKRRERGEAENMIEEFMLCANEAVATIAVNKKLPFVFRVHDEPELAKLMDLSMALSAAGLDTKNIKPGLSPLDLQKIQKKIEGTKKEKAIDSIMLRCMSKARYSPDCTGHFGLALKNYCHFTSPIRRYPDLSIHRILSDMLANGEGDLLDKHYKRFVSESSLNSSERELASMQIEWTCEDAYKAEYMSSHIGEQFEGTISSIKSFGMYVMLDNTVEGLVKIENIPGWYDYDEKNMMLRSSTTGKSFSIGDRVKVILAAAEVHTGRIDFTLL